MHDTIEQPSDETTRETSLVPSAGKVALTAAAAAALAACGGGSGDGGSHDSALPPDKSQDVNPFPTNAAEASRFLGQASLDANEASIAQVTEMGYEAWLEAQMVHDLSQPYRDWLIERGFHSAELNPASQNGWPEAVWCKLFSSPDSLRQKTVLAWTQLFVVSGLGLEIHWRNFAIANYLDTLESLAFGNFRDILEAVTLSSAMGHYLNMKGNKKADPTTGRVPDENFSREVMQLFTIGLYDLNPDGSRQLDGKSKPIESYSNDDTQGLAAVFTGWDTATTNDPDGLLPNGAYRHLLPMQLDEKLHTTTEKRFLGVTIPAGTGGKESLRIALDTLFNHQNTAPFVSRHFIQRFVTSNPSPAYVGRVSAVFTDNGQGVRGDMSSVIKAVLLDPEARLESNSSTFGKLREPVLRLLQWGRTFGAYSADGLWNLGFTDGDTRLGQMPLYSPSVFNFFRPGYVPPNTQIAEDGLVAPEFQILTEPTIVSYVNYMTGTVNNGRAVKVDYGPELQGARDVDAMVDRFNLWFAAGQISASALDGIKKAVQTIALPGTGDANPALRNRLYAALTLVMSSPQYLIQK